MRYKFNRLLGKVLYCIAIFVIMAGFTAAVPLFFVFDIICDFPHIDVKSFFEYFKGTYTELWEIIKKYWKEL